MTGTRHVIVADLGYGDAGKGSTVDWLCSPTSGGERRKSAATPYRAVIRYNGGAQAGHNVVTPSGAHHTFTQFGAGTLHGVATHLSRFMMVEPFALAAEADHLTALGVPDPFALLTIDADALLTTPYHRAANRAREAARDRSPGAARHGSCGLGIGETVAYALAASPEDVPRVGDCRNPAALIGKLTALREHLVADLELSDIPLGGGLPPVELCAEVYEEFAARTRIVGEEYLPRLLADGPCVFEGAQGVLLDEWRGFHPHTTWSTTTFANAETLLRESGESGDGDALRLGVVRTFTTRHGAGPLVTEDAALSAVIPEPHNGTGDWQGSFRIGHFDVVAHRYALEVCGGADALAITHADIVPSQLKICREYQTTDGLLTALKPCESPDLDYQRSLTAKASAAIPVLDDGPEAPDWPGLIGVELDLPIALVSHGPAWTQKSAAPKAFG